MMHGTGIKKTVNMLSGLHIKLLLC